MATPRQKAVMAVGGLALGGAIVLALSKKAGGHEPPPPGLANLYGDVANAATGVVIAGVRVTLDGYETTTDASGHYLLDNLEPGDYTLQFEKEGYETLTY